jgi:outer membrane receptor for ferrienterochelin and colicin
VGASIFEKKYKYYLYEDPNDPRYVHPKLMTTPDSYSFLTGGTDLSRTNRSTTTFLVKLDLSSQINETNLIKVGGDFTKYRVFYEYITLQPDVNQTDINLATDSPYIRTRVLDLSSNSHDMYTHQPKEFSFYAQDKMEFKDIIVNIGVRYDYFQPDGVVLTDETDPNIYRPIKPNNIFFDLNGNGIQDPGEQDKTVEDRAAYWYRKATAKWQISPRLGVSFPITDRGIVHFSYGHFFQIPRFERLYENPQFKIGTGTSGVIGNADLNPEQTIKGELGLQQQLTEDISGDLTVYVQDIRSLTGTQGQQIVVFRSAELPYSKYTNSDFGLVKGIVMTLNKRFSGGFDATLDYTYQVAKGSASDPKDARNAIAGGRQPEIQLNPLGWDQRQTLNITVAYSARHWGISSIAQYGSGSPYTPRATTDISSLLTNSQLKPSFFNLDLRAYYEIPLDLVNVVVFARVFNVFDTRNEVNVYDDTGRAGFTTDEGTALSTRPKEYVNTIDQWFLRPLNYSEPRRIEFGLNLEF